MISIRGATTILNNSEEEINKNTIELINEIIRVNNLNVEKIHTMIFSCTDDITKAYPGAFVRKYFDMKKLSLMHFNEMKVDNYLKLCIRVLILSNEDKDQIKFVYLNNAKSLRKDLNQ
ncbi:chorismate mutase [Clostridium sp. UBA4548]|nr:chorismate mutase [Clostridium sp. UBA4548]